MMRFFLIFLNFLIFSSFVRAQNTDFENFLKKFPTASLPYTCVVKPKTKFPKSSEMTKEVAEMYFSGFKNTHGHAVNHYESVIEPYGPEKGENGKIISSLAKAWYVALLKRTDNYVLVLTYLTFENKGIDYMEGEQYLLHSFTANGQPIQVLNLAQRVQFDLHSNKVSGKIDTDGNIICTVEIFAPSDNSKREEKYRITEQGRIEEIKE